MIELWKHSLLIILKYTLLLSKSCQSCQSGSSPWGRWNLRGIDNRPTKHEQHPREWGQLPNMCRSNYFVLQSLCVSHFARPSKNNICWLFPVVIASPIDADWHFCRRFYTFSGTAKGSPTVFKMLLELCGYQMASWSSLPGDAELADSDKHPSAFDANQNYAWTSHVSRTGDKKKQEGRIYILASKQKIRKYSVQGDNTVTRRYYYAIKEISIGGRWVEDILVNLDNCHMIDVDRMSYNWLRKEEIVNFDSGVFATVTHIFAPSQSWSPGSCNAIVSMGNFNNIFIFVFVFMANLLFSDFHLLS